MLYLDLKTEISDVVETVPSDRYLSDEITFKNVMKGILAATIPGSCTPMLYLENKRE